MKLFKLLQIKLEFIGARDIIFLLIINNKDCTHMKGKMFGLAYLCKDIGFIILHVFGFDFTVFHSVPCTLQSDLNQLWKGVLTNTSCKLIFMFFALIYALSLAYIYALTLTRGLGNTRNTNMLHLRKHYLTRIFGQNIFLCLCEVNIHPYIILPVGLSNFNYFMYIHELIWQNK